MAAPQPPPKPSCTNLVLDAGPLLSLSPLRGLAETYWTVPQVLDELQDRRAREHFEQLGLTAGVRVQVRAPDAAALAHVIEFAKKTGDYAVLSHADVCVLALTYALDLQDKQERAMHANAGPEGEKAEEHSSDAPISTEADASHEEAISDDTRLAENLDALALEEHGDHLEDQMLEHDGEETPHPEDAGDEDREPLAVELVPVVDELALTANPEPTSPKGAPSTSDDGAPTSPTSSDTGAPDAPFDDPSDSGDGEGEWITPANVGTHKSKYLDNLPSHAGKNGKGKEPEHVGAGCMTADFAMQNVLLQMGMNLVGVEGRRIDRVKTWVLRCHACFKICKDPSKQFCPSCGNATLLRAAVTVSAPSAPGAEPKMQVHLKKNFQYKLRGTVYAIPAPKAGSAKTGPGTGLVLREDQAEYVRARRLADGKRAREERRAVSGAMARGPEGQGAGKMGSWMDPDWVPEMLSVGAGGKGRTARGAGEMPTVGYGRKNPNERRRKK